MLVLTPNRSPRRSFLAPREDVHLSTFTIIFLQNIICTHKV